MRHLLLSEYDQDALQYFHYIDHMNDDEKEFYLHEILSGKKSREKLYLESLLAGHRELEMGIVGRFQSQDGNMYRIWICPDEAFLPHFHVRCSNMTWGAFHCCIEFMRAMYFDQKHASGILKNLARDSLIGFLERPLGGVNNRKISNWEWLCEAWRRNNPGIYLPHDINMPDYSRLTTE